MSSRALSAALLVAIGSALACSSDPSESSNVSNATAEAPIYGDDRVGRALKGHPENTPADFASFEALFNVGRKCPSTTSKEMFVIEEGQSRDGGHVQQTSVLPRAVVTGCGNGTTRDSYSLMTALFSPGSSAGSPDPLLLTPLEAMALDDTTGLYNFYVFSSGPTVTRVVRAADGTVHKFQKTGSGPARSNDGASTNPCFSCHVNGGPIMNELHDPWTNWVSFHSEGFSKAELGKLSGTTLAIINEAIPSGGHGSLAGTLETTILAANQEFVSGQKAGSGWGNAIVDGRVPGGVPQLLKSVFCQTQLEFASTIAGSTMPKEVFVDPIATAAAHPETSAAASLPLFQFPIRSEFDKRAEVFAKDAGFLTPTAVAAIRLVDDESDIFSDARCSLLPLITSKVGKSKTPADVDTAVRSVLSSKLDTFPRMAQTPNRRAYMATLLDAAKSGDLTATRTAYVEEFNARFTKMLADSHEDAGKAALATKDVARKKAARAMFDPSENPLPLLGE